MIDITKECFKVMGLCDPKVTKEDRDEIERDEQEQEDRFLALDNKERNEHRLPYEDYPHA